jgi:anti-sigma B factor antagonist
VSVAHPAKGQAVVSAPGDLDLPGAGALREPLSAALASPLVVLDLSRCTFCNSSGLRTILEAAHHAHLAGNSFRVAGVGVQVGRIFELTGSASIRSTLTTLKCGNNRSRVSVRTFDDPTEMTLRHRFTTILPEP